MEADHDTGHHRRYGGLSTWARGVNAETISTPYGEAAIFRLQFNGREVIFLTRHGAGHRVPPHRVNYRANIWALRALGVDEVLATQAVGSINPHMELGHFALLAQFLDFTKCRPSTFFDGADERVVHIDITHPYCPRLTGRLLRAGRIPRMSNCTAMPSMPARKGRVLRPRRKSRRSHAGRRCGGDDECA